MRAFNITRQCVLVEHGKVAQTAWTRLKGLIGHAPLHQGEGLLIHPCQGVHSFLMRFPIDVVYVSGAGQVVRTVEHLVPGRIGPIALDARFVLELPAGTITRTQTAVGDRITVEY